jgi:hypothetical protein
VRREGGAPGRDDDRSEEEADQQLAGEAERDDEDGCDCDGDPEEPGVGHRAPYGRPGCSARSRSRVKRYTSTGTKSITGASANWRATSEA